MPVLVTGIHVFRFPVKNTWIAGTGPAMTTEGRLRARDSCID